MDKSSYSGSTCLAREFLESWMVLIILMFGCTEEDIRLKYINTHLTSVNLLIVFLSNIYISFLFVIDFICYQR